MFRSSFNSMDSIVKEINAALMPLKISGCCGLLYQQELDFAKRGAEAVGKAAAAMDHAASQLHGQDAKAATAAALKLHAASNLANHVIQQ